MLSASDLSLGTGVGAFIALGLRLSLQWILLPALFFSAIRAACLREDNRCLRRPLLPADQQAAGGGNIVDVGSGHLHRISRTALFVHINVGLTAKMHLAKMTPIARRRQHLFARPVPALYAHLPLPPHSTQHIPSVTR